MRNHSSRHGSWKTWPADKSHNIEVERTAITSRDGCDLVEIIAPAKECVVTYSARRCFQAMFGHHVWQKRSRSVQRQNSRAPRYVKRIIHCVTPARPTLAVNECMNVENASRRGQEDECDVTLGLLLDIRGVMKVLIQSISLHIKSTSLSPYPTSLQAGLKPEIASSMHTQYLDTGFKSSRFIAAYFVVAILARLFATRRPPLVAYLVSEHATAVLNPSSLIKSIIATFHSPPSHNVT